MNKNIFRSFMLLIRYNFGTLILFELFHKGIAVALVLPLIKYIFERAMYNAGIVYLSTENVINILTNPISIILIIISLLAFTFYVFFEFTSVIICFDKSIRYEKIGVFSLIKSGLKKSIRILYPKNTLLIVFILLIIPLTNLILISGFIGKIKLPDYILDFIKSNNVLNIVYIGLMLLLCMVVIRWIFTIHEMTLKTSTFKEAKRVSHSITKGKTIKILIYSIGIFLLSALLGSIIYYSLIILIGIWTKNYGNVINLKELFISRCIMFNSIVIFFSSTFGFIISLGFISSIYYEYNGFELNKYKLIKRSRSVLKTILKTIVILILIQSETLAFSFNSNTMFNLEFFYNTTATAHRGYSMLAPENTLSAFKEAINSQVEYIETDVQEIKDGELILLHDTNFKRTTGIDKNIWDVNYEEVETYDAGSYFSYDYLGEKVPTLDETIKYVKGKSKLIIEIKLNDHESPDIVEKVINIIKKNNYEDKCIIASMKKEVLKKVKEIDSNIISCYLTALAYGDLYDWEYVDIYGIESTFINKHVVEEVHSRGKQIFVWTVNDQELMSKMIDLNIDSIITDNPYLVEDTIYWKKNNFINKVANYLF